MSASRIDLESLKIILENISQPDALDAHPWADLAFVNEAVSRHPNLREAGAGKRLVFAVESMFYETMPGAPPRRGKRLDTQWGEFGLLAAQYFAPVRFGAPIPNSLREAWGRIDRSIQLYVFGREAGDLDAAQSANYALVANESEAAPNSTLSDWHRKGLEKLAETIRARQRYLDDQALVVGDGNASDSAEPDRGSGRSARRKGDPAMTRKIILALTALFLLALLFTVIKARRIYDLGMGLMDQTAELRDLAAGGVSIQNMRTLGPVLSQYRKDYLLLKREATPFLWIGPLLGWVPEYGGDLASIGNLVTLSDSMLAAADITYQAMSPLLDVMEDTQNSAGFDPARFTEILSEAQPQLLEAQKEMERATEARERIDLERLSPRVREMMVKYVDRVLPWMRDGVVVAAEFPRLMGSTSEGPKTYLLLAQNEDEVRPTGGFITAAGTMLVQNGKIGEIDFVDTGGLEEWDKAYPSAPWQLKQYMNSPVLIFRDVNWFVDYPTAVLYAESLYAYQKNHSVDGVVSIDQHVLVELLRVIGPVTVEGAGEPIGADNVVDYMRAYKVPPGGPSNPFAIGWNSKGFINKLTTALLSRIVSGNFQWEQLSMLAIQMLNERHILVQVDNPSVTAVLARRGWDGAVRPQGGDYVMVTDFNTGFNKTNAMVSVSLSYEVDLSNLESPIGRLGILHQNNAVNVPCVPGPYFDQASVDPQYFESDYPIDRCYWAYVRVYTPTGADLLQANVQTIPAEWMLYEQEVPPQVDVLDEEITGVAGFGFLKVVPGGESVETNLRFALPPGVVKQLPRSDVWSYQLHFQKQPGTVAPPLTLRFRLPPGATVESLPPGATVQEDGSILLVTDLRESRDLTILFTLP